MEIFIAALIIAAVVLILYMLLKKKKKKPEEKPVVNLLVPEEEEKTEFEPPSPVTFTEDLEVSFDGINDELEDALTEHSLFYSAQTAVKPEYNSQKAPPATHQPPKTPAFDIMKYLKDTTVITDDDAVADENVLKTIRSFLSGNYYFDGEMIANGEKSPMEIAMSGNDFQVYSELDGKDISIMQSDSKTYMLNPDTKKYTELTASFQKMVGIDTSNLRFAFNSNGVDATKPDSVKKAVFNGNDAVCVIYKNSQTHLEFIVSDTEILQMTLFNEKAEAINILIADEFTAEIPDNMLTFKGYSKTNMISFLKSLM